MLVKATKIIGITTLSTIGCAISGIYVGEHIDSNAGKRIKDGNKFKGFLTGMVTGCVGGIYIARLTL